MLINSISSWQTHIFDIAAQFDYDYVLDDFSLRQDIFKKIPTYYRSLTLPGAKAAYPDSELALLRWVRGWMRSKAN
jgi:hypothetical protein